jgi:hypothetical protein
VRKKSHVNTLGKNTLGKPCEQPSISAAFMSGLRSKIFGKKSICKKHGEIPPSSYSVNTTVQQLFACAYSVIGIKSDPEVISSGLEDVHRLYK